MLSEIIQEKTRKLNVEIRRFAMQNDIYNYRITGEPLGGSIKDSIGPWPEYILHGIKCIRSEKGYCSPCGYSLDGFAPCCLKKNELKIIREKIYQQAMKIIKYFDSMVIHKQFRAFQDEERVYFVLTSVGSFFNDMEVPFELKNKILSKIQKIKEKKRLNIYLFTEVRPEDILEYESQGKLQRIAPVLNSLNTTIVLGLESIDETVRNYAYFKNLTLKTFEEAVKLLKNYSIKVGAFVFAGAHSLTQSETLKDFEKTVSYLYSHKIMPVVMIANIKICTLDHLLFILGKHRLIEPRTTLEIMRILRRKEEKIEPEPWLIADPVGGPPEPVFHPFRNRKMVTCSDCSSVILSGLRYIRKTYKWNNFDILVRPETEECDCADDYKNFLKNEMQFHKIPLQERILMNLEFAEKNLAKYYKYLLRRTLNLKSHQQKESR